VLPVDLDDCGFWPHVVSSWRKWVKASGRPFAFD